MKTLIMAAFLVISLGACASVAAPIPSTPTHIPETLTPTLESRSIPVTPTALSVTTIPILTPDATQVTNWQVYQVELARHVLGFGGGLYPYPAQALCEWDILGRDGPKVYVWAECEGPNIADRVPVVIYLNADGGIQNIEPLLHLSTWQENMKKMFPVDIQKKIYAYKGDSINPGRSEELRMHLVWREQHPGEPPLIVLSATPVP